MGVITRGIANNILSGGTIDATDGLSGTVSASNITDSSISSVTAFPAAAGDFIQSTASDPSPATIGDVWYNNATYAFKVASIQASAWASEGNLNTARGLSAGTGIQTAALYMGGFPASAVVESWNGTSWTTSPSLNTARYGLSATGTQTSALAFSGIEGATIGVATEKYNGTSWTSVNSMNTARVYAAGAGTQTATLTFGGGNPNKTSLNATESYNGTTWTSSPSVLALARMGFGGSGTQTSALAFGGGPTDDGAPVFTETEEWGGSSWTSGGSLNTGRQFLGSAVAGTQTSALAFGGLGVPTITTATELYNGTSWTSNPTGLNTARFAVAGAGTQSSALAFGKFPAGTNTESWTGGGLVTKTITTS